MVVRSPLAANLHGSPVSFLGDSPVNTLRSEVPGTSPGPILHASRLFACLDIGTQHGRGRATIPYSNVRSFLNKRDNLESLVSEASPELVVFTETWLVNVSLTPG